MKPDAMTASVQGGALWADVDAATQAHGLATPGGLISETGVAGLTLSGGVGWLRSAHGLCIDNLLAVDIVTADGALIRASLSENPDLFWAIRGGGGNFGIVVNFEFKLHPVGPTVMFAAPIYPLSAGAGPIKFWRDFLGRQERCCRVHLRVLHGPSQSRLSREVLGDQVLHACRCLCR